MANLLNEWLFMADADLASAKFQLGKETFSHISVYQSHQAVEKILKSFLVANHLEIIPRVHDLRKLYQQSKLFGLDLQSEENDLLELDAYFPRLRYPLGDRISVDEASRCYEIAASIFNKIKLMLDR